MAMGNAGACRLRAVRGYPPHASLAPEWRASSRTMTTTSLFVSCKYLHASWHQHFLLSGYTPVGRGLAAMAVLGLSKTIDATPSP